MQTGSFKTVGVHQDAVSIALRAPDMFVTSDCFAAQHLWAVYKHNA